MGLLKSIPNKHRSFLNKTVDVLKADKRILGIAGGGSLVLDTMDEYSDLDLIIVVDPEHYSKILDERRLIASKPDNLLEAFTGEHVGEPRLLICLYGPPLLHVDLKFVSFSDINDRVEDPVVIWERGNILSEAFSAKSASFPAPDIEWIENRFWIWIHYTVDKIARGELFEASEDLSFLRSQVLGPLILQKVGARPQGVRRIEQYAPEYTEQLKATIPQYNRKSCYQALSATIDLYEDLCKARLTDKDPAHKKLISEVKEYLNRYA